MSIFSTGGVVPDTDVFLKPEDAKTNDLELHISIFSSDFDNTSIGHQLRNENVSVRLYAEIRDVLWKRNKDLMKYNAEYKNTMLEIYEVMEPYLDR